MTHFTYYIAYTKTRVRENKNIKSTIHTVAEMGFRDKVITGEKKN